MMNLQNKLKEINKPIKILMLIYTITSGAFITIPLLGLIAYPLAVVLLGLIFRIPVSKAPMEHENGWTVIFLMSFVVVVLFILILVVLIKKFKPQIIKIFKWFDNIENYDKIQIITIVELIYFIFWMLHRFSIIAIILLFCLVKRYKLINEIKEYYNNEQVNTKTLNENINEKEEKDTVAVNKKVTNKTNNLQKLAKQLKNINKAIQIMVALYLVGIIVVIQWLLTIVFTGASVSMGLLHLISKIDATATIDTPFAKMCLYFFTTVILLLVGIGIAIMILTPLFKKIYKTLNNPEKYNTIKTVTLIEVIYLAGVTCASFRGNFRLLISSLLSSLLIALPLILRFKTVLDIEKIYEEKKNNEEQDSKTIQEETKNTDKSE